MINPNLTMDHHHLEDNCSHESHDGDHDHDHDHDSSDLGPRDNLFQYIDRPNVVALNATGPGSDVIKPWNERLDEEKVCPSSELLPNTPSLLFVSSLSRQMPTIRCIPYTLSLLTFCFTLMQSKYTEL